MFGQLLYYICKNKKFTKYQFLKINDFRRLLYLACGDPGINPLDSACKEHDIAYSRNRENIQARNEADKILAEKAKKRNGIVLNQKTRVVVKKRLHRL